MNNKIVVLKTSGDEKLHLDINHALNLVINHSVVITDEEIEDRIVTLMARNIEPTFDECWKYIKSRINQ